MISSLAMIVSIWEGLIHLVVEKYPDLLVIIVVGTVVWFVTHRWDKLYGRFKTTEAQCNTIQDYYIPDLHNKFKSIDKKLTVVLVSVQKISMYLITVAGLDSKIFDAKSPLRLTALGDSILLKSGGKDYVDRMLKDFIKVIDLNAPKSGLDVQNFSNSVLMERTLGDDFVPINNFVYQNPSFKFNELAVNIDLGMTIQIMGIYLRDKYFEARPELQKDVLTQ